MQIPVQQFPILSPGQMNPFHQALQSGLDTYMNMTKAAYQPASMQADIASKAAYATYSPYSYLSKALSDPTMLALLANNPDQFKAIMGKLVNMPTNPYASLGMGNMPGVSSPNEGKGMWDKLKDFVGLGNEKNSGTPAQPNQMPNENNGEQNPNATVPSNYNFSPENIRQQAFLKAFPNSPQAQEIKLQNDLWQDRLKEEGKTVDDTQRTITTLNSMKSLYPQLGKYEKGVGFGSFKALTSNAQAFDQFAENQSTANIRALQSGHITNTDFQIGNKLKPSRSMNEEAFNKMEDYNLALAMRARQKQRFMSEAHNRGIPVENADTAWSNFIEQNPLFDSKTQKLIKNNYQKNPFMMNNQSSPNKSGSNQSSSSKLPVSRGAKILAKQIQLPSFGSVQEYEKWLSSQPQITQDAIIEKFGGQ